MSKFERTDIGGLQGRFQTTQWSMMNALAGLGDQERKAVLDELARRYWKPVYCYLRRKGYDNEQAKDLTQGFFHEIVMVNRLIERADEAKGRFRTFLLTALDRYVVTIHRRQTAAKRYPTAPVASLDAAEDETLSVRSKDLGPDEAFTYAWAAELLEGVLAEIKQRCAKDGKAVHWEMFQRRILDPIVTGQEPPSLPLLCEQFHVDTPVRAENMIVTIKRRFQTAMKVRVREYVASDDEVEPEIRELMAILSR